MKAKQTTERQKTMIEPFYIRIPSNIFYWFVKKGTNIKDSFLAYIKSKETWKAWRRRLIVVGVIVLILVSFKVKSFLNLYPYSEDDYLITNKDRVTLTDYNGSSGYERLSTFFENFDSKTDDAVKLTYTIMGYNVTEEIVYDSDSNTIELIVDNRKNKMISKNERKKETYVYTGVKTKITSDAKRQYCLTVDGKPDYLLAQADLSKVYGLQN